MADWSWEDEEEEDEPAYVGCGSRPASSNADARAADGRSAPEDPDDDEEASNGGDLSARVDDGNAMDDFAGLAGLRRRQRAPGGAAHAGAALWREGGRGGVGGYDGCGVGAFLDADDSEFLLGSERLDYVCAGPKATQPWRQFCLVALLVAGLCVAACDRRPSKDSFDELRAQRYGADAQHPPGSSLVELGLPILTDRSFEGKVMGSRYAEHGPVALGIVRLRAVAGTDATKGKTKLYEHRYLGIVGSWIPLPYLPQPGTKAGVYGVGACVLGRCICVPKPQRGNKASSSGSAADKPRSPARTECMRFEGGKSAALNVMAVPNIILFMLWQFPGYWGRLSSHATLSMSNLARGRLWVLLAAPFSHRSWGEAFQSAVLLANTLDSFDRAEVHFAVYFALYVVGCWAAWFGRCVFYRRVVQNDSSAFYAQESGAAGGLAALLLFLARTRPEEQFQFSLYFVPIPVTLSAWQSCFAHGLLDILFAKGTGVWRQSLAHASAWAVGWAVAGAWLKHI